MNCLRCAEFAKVQLAAKFPGAFHKTRSNIGVGNGTKIWYSLHNSSKNIWNSMIQNNLKKRAQKIWNAWKSIAHKNIWNTKAQKTEIMKSVFCSDFHISSKRERNCACLEKENRFSLQLSEKTKKKFDFCKNLLLSEVIMIFHILHSLHNNPIITIWTNTCTQFY